MKLSPWGVVFALAVALVRPAGAELPAWTATDIAEVARLVNGNSQQILALRGSGDPLRTEDGRRWTPFRVMGALPKELQVSTSDPPTWYATAGGALYRSQDGGATWTIRSTEFPASNITSAGLFNIRAGAHPDLLYSTHVAQAFCGFNECLTAYGAGRVSTDGGANWRSANIDGLMSGLHPSPADARVVYAMQRNQMSRSDDQGATWTRVTPPISEAFAHYLAMGFVTLDRRDPMVAYVRLWGGGTQPRSLFATRDGGRTWIEHTVMEGDLVADPLHAGRAYLFGNDGSLMETRDTGRTWIKVEMPYVLSRDEVRAGGPAQGAVFVAEGERVGLRLHGGKLERIDLGDGALAIGSDLWWNPAESGTGLTITQHPNRQVFVVWYAYDSAGAPVWRVASGGTWQDRTFSGPLYETRAAPWFGGAFAASSVTLRLVGEITLRFDNESNAVFSYRLQDGASGEKRVTRQLFGVEARVNTAFSYADLWWNASESGWGISINHQHNTIFATWFIYDEQGRPAWVVMPDARVGMTFVGVVTRPYAAGDIYIARGPSSSGPFDPSKVVLTRIGQGSFTFEGRDNAALDFEAFGRAETRRITRQPF